MTGQHARDGFDAETRALPAAGYLPAHDPAVHGRAYAVKHAGRDTVTFPAIPAEEPEPCRCGTSACPDRDRSQDGPMPTETRAVLSCGPGVVSKMWRTRVRNGEWKDIRGLFRTARQRVEDAAGKGQGAIHNNLDCDWHDIAAVFRADAGLLTDPDLAEGLHRMERELAQRLLDMEAARAGRTAESRRAEEEERWSAA